MPAWPEEMFDAAPLDVGEPLICIEQSAPPFGHRCNDS